MRGSRGRAAGANDKSPLASNARHLFLGVFFPVRFIALFDRRQHGRVPAQAGRIAEKFAACANRIVVRFHRRFQLNHIGTECREMF